MLFMEVANSKGYLHSVKLSSFFGEASCVSQMHEELTTSHEAHDEEDLRLCLEHVVHANEERMIGLHENLLLKLGAFDLIVVEDDIFSKGFHGINLLGILLLD